MAIVHIPDALDFSLQQTADRLGCPKDDLLQDAIAQRIAEYEEIEPELTSDQIAHLRKGIAQLDRGEGIGSEQVDAWFANLFRRLAARSE